MPMGELYAYLLEMKLVTPIFAKPRDDPSCLVLNHLKNVNTIFGAKGHTWEECVHLRLRIQDLIDNSGDKYILFDCRVLRAQIKSSADRGIIWIQREVIWRSDCMAASLCP
ncbi:hypothetical protein SO802_012396 [Lithocarpus litseifolius]|uniref:Uncharacterized protein n=1 Tax=Lithocarpus litseifolius TaxID=425828 RepID=A0AAW2D673_9ROSI